MNLYLYIYLSNQKRVLYTLWLFYKESIYINIYTKERSSVRIPRRDIRIDNAVPETSAPLSDAQSSESAQKCL